MPSKLRGLSREEFHRLQQEVSVTGSFSLHSYNESLAPLVKNSQVLEIETIKDPQGIKKFDPIIFWQDGSLYCEYLWGINRTLVEDENLLLLTRPFSPLNGPDTPVPMIHVLGRPKALKLSPWRKLLILIHAVLTRRF